MAVEDDSAEAMFECILEWATETKNMELYEAQEEAIMELVEGGVLLTTPTGVVRPSSRPPRSPPRPPEETYVRAKSFGCGPDARIASESRIRGRIRPRRGLIRPDFSPSRSIVGAKKRRTRWASTREPNRRALRI